MPDIYTKLNDTDTLLLAFDEIDSTNDEAKRRINSGALRHQACWISAKTQSKGRGRIGRKWVSAEGNLYATLCLPLAELSAKTTQLSFVTAVAVARCVQRLLNEQVTVECKWPNDILLEGCKVSGILLESLRTKEGDDWAILGIGMNVQHSPDETRWPSISLFDIEGTAINVEIALIALDKEVQHWVKQWVHFGFEPIRQAWTNLAFGIGQKIRYSSNQEEIDGVFVGLDQDGAAALRLDSGQAFNVYSGEIHFPKNIGNRHAACN